MKKKEFTGGDHDIMITSNLKTTLNSTRLTSTLAAPIDYRSHGPIGSTIMPDTPKGLNGGSGLNFVAGFPVKHLIAYKYNEDKALQDIAEYIDKTYSEHYSKNKYQATEFIIDGGHGTGFNIGNVLKYAQRYGNKDTPSEWRKDLMKVIHYAIIQLHVHDLNHNKEV